MKKPAVLNDREIEGLAYYFAFWWAVLALSPGNNRSIRSILVSHGFIEPKGKLALTKAGERVMRFVKDEGRPKYPAKRKK